MGYDQDPATSWSALPESTDRELRLHELSDNMLSLLMVACETALSDYNGKGKAKKSHHVDKLRISHDSADSILQQRKHPRGLTRRLDFVPFVDFQEDRVTLEMLRDACFAENEVAWLTNSTPLPPVQMWAGYEMSNFDLQTLVALFTRALRDDCCTSIQASSVPAVYEARLTTPSRLRLMNPEQGAKASVHKGRLVWIAEDTDLDARFRKEWEELVDRPLGLKGFQENFGVGTMHMIDAMDVTNSKMDIHPSISLPQRETEAAAATRAEPEAEADMLPGAVDESIETCKIGSVFVWSLYLPLAIIS